MRFSIFIGIVFFLSFAAAAQNAVPKTLQAKRASGTIKIDGILNDTAWKDAAVMADLIEFRPNVGKHEDYANRTETYLMYNDEGIYFGGFCHERTKDSIATELKGRDGFGTNDYIGIIFDTYHDKLNGFEYFVTAFGRSVGCQNEPSYHLMQIWKILPGMLFGKVIATITDSGWSFEMFIPFSAIRFGKDDVQDWGFNITRRRRKTEQQYTWNPIDPNVNGFLTQEGIWQGLSNIKPPIRLQFSPYLSLLRQSLSL